MLGKNLMNSSDFEANDLTIVNLVKISGITSIAASDFVVIDMLLQLKHFALLLVCCLKI